MKKLINAIYEELISWSEAIYEYRKSNYNRSWY